MSFIPLFLNCIFLPISTIMVFLPYIFRFIGLSIIGPIAGGLFSTMQGAGIVSGSFMAMIQSLAMGGWVITIQSFGIIGWVIFSICNLINK